MDQDEDPSEPWHGTPGGTTNHKCKGPLCREAWAAEMRKNADKRKRRGLKPDDPRHGTVNSYRSWGCRCAACREAQRIARKVN